MNINKNNKISVYTDHLLLTFFILMSGGGFTYGLFSKWPYILCPIIIYIFLKRNYKINSKGIFIIIAFATIFTFQMLKWNATYTSVILPIIKIISLVLFTRIILPSFNTTFVNIIYIFSVTSLIIWCICIFPAGYNVIYNISTSLPQLGIENIWETREGIESMYTCYLYNLKNPNFYEGIELIRNSGPFWEPGRFIIYIIIALMIQTFNNTNKFISIRNIVLLFACITTFSTTGYIALAMLFITLNFRSRRHPIINASILLVMSIVIYQLARLDFMGAKIISQATSLTSTESRFGAMLYHYSQIKQSPFIGYGMYLDRAYNIIEISPNGWTELLRFYGIPFSLFLLYLLYNGISKYIYNNNATTRIFAFIILMILAFTQTCLTEPFYCILYFFAIYSTNNIYSIKQISG